MLLSRFFHNYTQLNANTQQPPTVVHDCKSRAPRDAPLTSSDDEKEEEESALLTQRINSHDAGSNLDGHLLVARRQTGYWATSEWAAS